MAAASALLIGLPNRVPVISLSKSPMLDLWHGEGGRQDSFCRDSIMAEL